jgi:hypothetical protein
MRTLIHSLPQYHALDDVNRELADAVSVVAHPHYTAAERAWFRAPLAMVRMVQS